MSARAPAARVAAEAKLNLSLRITGRMANGYHALHTLFQRVALADIVTVRVDTPHRSLVCDAPAIGPVEHNLGWRAAAAFCQAAAWDTGFAITLEKHIPIGGGMGGGSADAAAVLRALNALAPGRIEAWQQDRRALAPVELRRRVNGHGARFIHVDGDHTHEALAHDLELAHAVLNERGVIALDDMLHPGYPTLIVTVVEYLTRHPEMRVMCIIDREDISAAAKFLICRTDVADLYERDLMQSFARFHFEPGARMMGHVTLVLTPEPRLAEI